MVTTYRRLVAVDPGGATGVAWKTGAGYASKTIDRWQDVPAFVRRLLPDLVVAEDFIINDGTSKKTAATMSLRCLGALECDCEAGVVPFVLQTPAQGKSGVSNRQIRAAGAWEPGQTDHQRDALRHLLWYEARTGDRVVQEALMSVVDC